MVIRPPMAASCFPTVQQNAEQVICQCMEQLLSGLVDPSFPLQGDVPSAPAILQVLVCLLYTCSHAVLLLGRLNHLGKWAHQLHCRALLLVHQQLSLGALALLLLVFCCSAGSFSGQMGRTG